MSTSKFWKSQPGTALYTAGFAIRNCVELPVLLLIYTLPGARPDRHWTYRQAFTTTFVRKFLNYVAAVELRPPEKVTGSKPKSPGQEEAGAGASASAGAGKQNTVTVTIDPARDLDGGDEVYRGILRCDPAITPGRIDGVWYGKPITRADQHRPGDRVFLHFHGGAYVIGSADDPDTAAACTSLLRGAAPGAAVLSPEYRLASRGGRFPAALQDAVTAYAHLVRDLRIPPADVVVSGDSAGGNLAFALVRYLNAVNADADASGRIKSSLPEPGGLLLWSPWPDLTVEVDGAASRPTAKTDYVPPALIDWGYRCFLPDQEATGIGRENPYLSPVRQAVPTRVPIYLQWGTAEVLAEDMEQLAAVQGAWPGGRFKAREVPHAPHNILMTAHWLGWTEESDSAVDEAMRFLDENRD